MPLFKNILHEAAHTDSRNGFPLTLHLRTQHQGLCGHLGPSELSNPVVQSTAPSHLPSRLWQSTCWSRTRRPHWKSPAATDSRAGGRTASPTADSVDCTNAPSGIETRVVLANMSFPNSTLLVEIERVARQETPERSGRLVFRGPLALEAYSLYSSRHLCRGPKPLWGHADPRLWGPVAGCSLFQPSLSRLQGLFPGSQFALICAPLRNFPLLPPVWRTKIQSSLCHFKITLTRLHEPHGGRHPAFSPQGLWSTHHR